jgi:hypothetical protein
MSTIKWSLEAVTISTERWAWLQAFWPDVDTAEIDNAAYPLATVFEG